MISLEEFAFQEIRDYIKTDYSVYNPDDTVSKVIGELSTGKHDEVIVREGNKIGFVTVSDLLRVVQPQHTKIGGHPGDRWNVFGVVSPSYTVLDIVEKLVENKVRALPVAEEGKIKGFICQDDLVKGLTEVRELSGEKAKDIAVVPLLSMPYNQNVAGARKMMLEHDISHVPVLRNGKLVGIVTAREIVNRFITPIGETTVGDAGGRKVPRFSGTLEDIMDDNPVTIGPDASIKEAVDKMIAREASAVIQQIEDGVPIAIITPRELLSLVLRLRGDETLPIYITGLNNIGDFMERAVIEEKIRRVMERITKMHPHLAEVSIHIQAKQTKGNRSRYEIAVNVISKATDERFAFNKEGWDAINVFDEVGETLNRLLTESKHKPRKISETQKLIKFSLREKPN